MKKTEAAGDETPPAAVESERSHVPVPEGQVYATSPKKKILVVEEFPGISLEMSKCGWSVEVYHPRTLASTATADIPRRIKSKEFDKLWLELPNVKRAIAPRRCTAVLNDVASWMNAALEAKTAAYLTGVRGRHWQEAPIAGLASTKLYHEADFALCRFDISTGEDPGTKSSLQVHIISTVPVKPLKCKCAEGVPHEHGSDKNKRSRSQTGEGCSLKTSTAAAIKKSVGSQFDGLFPGSWC